MISYSLDIKNKKDNRRIKRKASVLTLRIALSAFCFLLFAFCSNAQGTYTIQGHFPKFPNSKYELKGYEGLQQITIATTNSKEEGKFELEYPKNYIGNAQLYMNGAYLTLLFLNQENIHIFWEDLTKREDMKITNSKEYNAFLTGMKVFQESEAKLAGLHYLIPLYAQDSIKQKMFIQELDTVANAFPSYIKSLPNTLYVRQYLLTKGLIEQMPKTVETYTWRAPAHAPEFMAIDFKALKHSGLYKDIIEGYTNLVERFPLEEVYPLLNEAIDKVLNELKDEPTIQQELAQEWFTLLEQKSLFRSAEHLALKMLNQENCMLNDRSKDMFEQYRKLAIGKTAPNIILEYKDKRAKSKDLKSIKSKYKLVIFGASWCPNCKNDYSKWQEKYVELKKEYDVEVVYISLDTDLNEFEGFYKEAKFITYCDSKGWETQAAKDYYVFATPTYILLDKELKILAKINSPEHLQAWLEAKVKK
jgi:thiol-disulfide isomerase/thioredoxin